MFPGANAIPRYAVSPDGRSVAFEAGPQIARIRFISGSDGWIASKAQPLRATQATQNIVIQGLFWFPDGRTIGYFDEPNGKLKKVDVQSGAVQTLADVPSNQLAGSANAVGTIIYSSAANEGHHACVVDRRLCPRRSPPSILLARNWRNCGRGFCRTAATSCICPSLPN